MSPRHTLSLGDTLLQILFRFIVNTLYGAYLPRSYVGSDGLLRQHLLLLLLLTTCPSYDRVPQHLSQGVSVFLARKIASLVCCTSLPHSSLLCNVLTVHICLFCNSAYLLENRNCSQGVTRVPYCVQEVEFYIRPRVVSTSTGTVFCLTTCPTLHAAQRQPLFRFAASPPSLVLGQCYCFPMAGSMRCI